MGFEVIVTVDDSGPVLDGRWEPIIHAYRDHVEEELANDAVRRIRQYLPTQYMYLGHNGGDPVNNPIPSDAGFYLAHVHWDRSTDSSVLVNDGGYPAMIYGPWLEGIGPGNLYYGAVGRTRRGLPPRFPGYHAFQRTSGELNLVATDLAEAMLPPYLEALNG